MLLTVLMVHGIIAARLDSPSMVCRLGADSSSPLWALFSKPASLEPYRLPGLAWCIHTVRALPNLPNGVSIVNIVELETMTLSELRDMARARDISGYSRLKKQDLVFRLLKAHAEDQGFIFGGGVLDIVQDGIGFLRSERMMPGYEDVYVSQSQIRRFELRTGDMVFGQVRPAKESEKYYSLLRVEAINGLDPEQARRRPNFERLTPIFPYQQFMLETQPNVFATRLIDLLAPIGRGQRGLIVSPPKAGKTTILKQIANGITTNYSDAHLMVVLIGERPEEVTDMDRSVEAEVVHSTFDEPVQNHAQGGRDGPGAGQASGRDWAGRRHPAG